MTKRETVDISNHAISETIGMALDPRNLTSPEQLKHLDDIKKILELRARLPTNQSDEDWGEFVRMLYSGIVALWPRQDLRIAIGIGVAMSNADWPKLGGEFRDAILQQLSDGG